MSITPSMSCPSGGQFYACAGGSKFVGCCGTNPCGSNGCAAGNLASISFDATQYGLIPDEECSAGQFFTCTGVTPPFWGCCKSNPCASGCPASDLAGAFLSNNANTAAPYLLLNDTVSVSASSASSASASTTTSSATQSTNAPSPSTIAATVSALASASSASPSSSGSSGSSNTGAIAGGAVGGFAVLAALIFGLVWLLRRRRNSKTEKHHEAEVQQLDHGLRINEVATTKDSSKAYPPQSPIVPSYPGSPQPPYSPGPPSYVDERNTMHFSHELPGSPGGQELDSGQRYHAYRA